MAAGTCTHLRRDDAIASTHRRLGHTLAKGTSMRGIVAELFPTFVRSTPSRSRAPRRRRSATKRTFGAQAWALLEKTSGKRA